MLPLFTQPMTLSTWDLKDGKRWDTYICNKDTRDVQMSNIHQMWQVGNWTSQTGLFMDKDANITFHGGQSTVLDYIGHLANQTLRIVTLVEKPFIMLKNPQDRNNIQDDEIEGEPQSAFVDSPMDVAWWSWMPFCKLFPPPNRLLCWFDS